MDVENEVTVIKEEEIDVHNEPEDDFFRSEFISQSNLFVFAEKAKSVGQQGNLLLVPNNVDQEPSIQVNINQNQELGNCGHISTSHSVTLPTKTSNKRGLKTNNNKNTKNSSSKKKNTVILPKTYSNLLVLAQITRPDSHPETVILVPSVNIEQGPTTQTNISEKHESGDCGQPSTTRPVRSRKQTFTKRCLKTSDETKDSDNEYSPKKSKVNASKRKYICDYEGCGKQYKSLLGIKYHRLSHRMEDNQKVFKCKICDKIFNCDSQLEEHHIRKHTVETPFKCSFCEKTFKLNKDLTKHMITHEGRVGSDPQLDLTTNSRYGLRRRRSAHKSSDLKFENTDKSDVYEKDEEGSHSRQSFDSDYDEKSGVEENEPKDNKNDIKRENGKFICDFIGCGKQLSSKCHLNRHRKIHFKVKERKYICDVCHKSFFHGSHLKDHKIYKHTNETPFSCDVCGWKFKINNDLKKHIRTHLVPKLESERPINGCDLKTIQDRMYFTSQKRSLDCIDNMIRALNEEGTKPVPQTDTNGQIGCEWPTCQFKSDDKHKLIEHLESHKTSLSCWKCLVEGCDFKTAYFCSYSRHSILHKPESEVFLYRCEWPGCDYSSRIKGNRDKHRQCHADQNGFPCDWPECHKAFRSRKLLSAHQNIHKRSRVHTCQWPGCGYTTVDKGNYNKHRDKHLETKGPLRRGRKAQTNSE